MVCFTVAVDGGTVLKIRHELSSLGLGSPFKVTRFGGSVRAQALYVVVADVGILVSILTAALDRSLSELTGDFVFCCEF